MTREERLVKMEEQRTAAASLWAVGIPGLDLNQEELGQIHSRFSSWAVHYQLRILQSGLSTIVDDFEKLVYGIENSECEHKGVVRRGTDYQNCCGVSYEYINDLSCRGAIAIVFELCRGKIPSSLFERTQSLDERFRSVPKREGWVVNAAAVEKYKMMNYWWYEGLPFTVAE